MSVIRAGDTSQCPDADQLELLVRGDAADPRVELHVRDCAECGAAVGDIRENNRFLARATQVLRSGEPARRGEMTAADSIPGYRILSEIHRGGQGIVYKAYHEPTRRFVAIKLLLQGAFATPRQRHRFEREIEIAAGLRHPGIVRVYDTGALPGGRVGYVMEYIEGVPLDRCAARIRSETQPGSRPQVARLLQLLIKVCDAIRYAHERGIIHRDLKPGNIVVDADDQPHVLDFGLAKAVGAGLDDRERYRTLTCAGEMVGTCAYAAPEQMQGDPHQIDTRTDVYALGVIAYELLTGQLPYPVGSSMSEIVRSITEVEPRRPSALCPGIDDDLDTIVLKALTKEPARRYATAGALLDDLTRFQHGEAIDAKRDSLGYVLRKYVERHRVKVGFAAALLLVLVAGLITTLAYWRQAVAAQRGLERALERAEEREKETRQIADFQATMFYDIDPQTMGARLREDLLAEARAAMERSAAGPEQRAASLEELETLLAGANFTNLGVRSLDRNVLDPALAVIDRDFAGQPLVQAALWQTVAGVYHGLGMDEAARPPAERALETRRRLLGDDHPDTLKSISAMGDVLIQGMRAEAEPYIREALERRRRVLGDDHPDTLASIADMGELLGDQVRYSEAEPYYHEALEGYRRVLGDDHPATLDSIAGVGRLLWAQGKLSEAEPYVREALERRRRVLGDDHPVTLTSINNMGLLLKAQGRLAEAEPYEREALEGIRRALGDEHFNTLYRMNNLGALLREQGRFDEAETYVRQALETSRRVLGDEHPCTIYGMRNLGRLRRDQGRLAEAEVYLREALETSRRALGDDHSITIYNMGILESLLRDQGRIAEADALCP